MGFFEPPDPPHEKQEPRWSLPVWHGPPANALGTVVSLRRVLASWERGAVALAADSVALWDESEPSGPSGGWTSPYRIG